MTRHIPLTAWVILALLLGSAAGAWAQDSESASDAAGIDDTSLSGTTDTDADTDDMFDRPRSTHLDPGPIVAADEPTDEERDVPDYDGRELQQPAGTHALWIPRVLLSPLYLTNEYILRRPTRAAAIWVERNNVASRLLSFFTVGNAGKAGVVPTAFFDFGLRSSVGLYVFANDAPTEGDRLRMHFGYGGDNWWRVSLRERIDFGHGGASNHAFTATRLNFHLLYNQRPDYLLYSIGQARGGERALTYRREDFHASVDAEFRFGELDGLSVSVDGGHVQVRNGDPTIQAADGGISDAFSPSTLPGYDAFAVVRSTVALQLDSRPERVGDPGSGVRISPALTVGAAPALNATWATTGADLGLFWDLDGRARVLALHQHISSSISLGDAPTPFTELPTLGGIQFMRGFREGRFRGESAVSTLLEYRYPIWAFIDGYTWFSVGNTFDGFLEGISADSLASSFGMGFRSNGDRDGGVALLVGAGTAPFGEGASVESFRLVLGFQEGF